MAQYIFKRYEKKYLLSLEKYQTVLDALSQKTIPDKYGESDICNIYYDTSDFRIIRASILKPVYKEKLRLRCYGVPNNNSRCFLELKKKYKGVVYKRRISDCYEHGFKYLSGEADKISPSQIKSEIEYFRFINNFPKPAVNIFYKRIAFYDSSDPNVRFTFDRDLVFRDYDLDLNNGIYGNRILPQDKIIMEIKTTGAVPLWVSKLLNDLEIYPSPFSKYGTAYNIMLFDKSTTIN